MGQMYPNEVMKNIVPVVMAGVVGIFGLIVSVLIVLAIKLPVESEGVYINKYGWDLGFKHFASGLTLGLSGVAGGYAIGVVGSDAQKFVGLRKELFVPMILIISFAGAVPLYGLIGSMILVVSPRDLEVNCLLVAIPCTDPPARSPRISVSRALSNELSSRRRPWSAPRGGSGLLALCAAPARRQGAHPNIHQPSTNITHTTYPRNRSTPARGSAAPRPT
jgi:ATP synthase proteolipid subunit